MRRFGFLLGGALIAAATMAAAPASAAEPDCENGDLGSLLAEDCPSPASSPAEVEGVDRLKKSADRDSYKPGDVITFTIEISASASGTETDKFDVFDNMDDVLDDAVYNDDASATEGSAELQPIDGARILRWQGQLEPGESATLTFSVTTNAKGDKQIRNFALHAAHNGSECGFSRSHGPTPGDIDFDDVPAPCKVVVPPGEEQPPGDETSPPGDDNQPPGDNGGPSLPTTGQSLGVYIAAAAAMLVIGAVLLVMARKRRSRVAESE